MHRRWVTRLDANPHCARSRIRAALPFRPAAMTKRARGAGARGFVHERHDCLPPGKKEGGGAPKGASSQCPRRAIRCRHLKALRARCPHPTLPRTRGRAGRGLASRRSAAALAKATERFGSAQAALRAKERAPALPAPSIALKRSTPHPGRSAGGDDARAARERSYEPRPQEPHPPHQSAVTGDVPRMSGHFSVVGQPMTGPLPIFRVTQTGTSVNENVTNVTPSS